MSSSAVIGITKASIRFWLVPSINWLFALIPVTLILDRIHVPPPLVFFAAALAIIPIARMIVRSTEQLATRTGDAVGGLLNATFGNAPELIIALVALKSGYLDMVRASIIGAILANILLTLGVSFLLGGMRYHDQHFNPMAARTYSTMMFLAATSMLVPSAFSDYFAPESTIRQEQMLNIGIAIVLLLTYALYLWFALKTHPAEFFSADEGSNERHEIEHWSVTRATSTLVGASALAAWMSESLVGAAEGTGEALGMSQTFVGIVLVAIVGGAAEAGSAVTMARKNRVDLTIGIALGSSIQIALFVAPVLVVSSYLITPHPLELAFNRAEVGSLFLGVLLGAIVCGDGKSNWYKGVQLITVYIVLALMFYFVPNLSH